jgi:hypothetical protein
MAGPTTPEEALAWIREATASGHHVRHAYFVKRCRERNYRGLYDVNSVVETATHCERYEGRQIQPGSTLWSVFGALRDGETARLGVEAYMSGTQKMVLLVNIMTGGE